MTGCDLCGVGPEDECSMDCPSRRWVPDGGLVRLSEKEHAALIEEARVDRVLTTTFGLSEAWLLVKPSNRWALERLAQMRAPKEETTDG